MHEMIRDLGGDSGHEEFTCTGVTYPSDIVQLTDGKAGCVIGNKAYASGDVVSVATDAIVNLQSASGTTFVPGDVVNVTPADQLAVADGTALSIRAGVCMVAKTSGQTSVLVRLNSVPTQQQNTVRSIRRRCTTAEVNAGITLLPAVAGRRYRIVDMKMIAVGGAATTATSVDITATQSASSVKLLASAVAGLTQSAVLRAGAANAAVLADGASFVANDTNTAIGVSKTGSNMTVATAIDVFVDYVLEAA